MINNLKDQYIQLSSKERLHNIEIPIVALTGGIATGKSSAAKLFREKGFPLIDADQLVKSIYSTQVAIDFISTEFPTVVENNIINFPMLRQIAFGSPENKEKVENFIYARLPEAFHAKLKEFGDIPFIIYDVPLLFEKNLHSMVDLHLCVYASEATQIERLMKRDNIDELLAKTILAQQMPIEKKRKLAHMEIENTSDLETLKSNIDLILGKII